MQGTKEKIIKIEEDTPYTIDLFSSIIEHIRKDYPSASDFIFSFKDVPKKSIKLIRTSFSYKSSLPDVVVILNKKHTKDPALMSKLKLIDNKTNCMFYLIDYKDYNLVVPKTTLELVKPFRQTINMVRYGKEAVVNGQVISTIKKSFQGSILPTFVYIDDSTIPFRWCGNVRFVSAGSLAFREIGFIKENLLGIKS